MTLSFASSDPTPNQSEIFLLWRKIFPLSNFGWCHVSSNPVIITSHKDDCSDGKIALFQVFRFHIRQIIFGILIVGWSFELSLKKESVDCIRSVPFNHQHLTGSRDGGSAMSVGGISATVLRSFFTSWTRRRTWVKKIVMNKGFPLFLVFSQLPVVFLFRQTSSSLYL